MKNQLPKLILLGVLLFFYNAPIFSQTCNPSNVYFSVKQPSVVGGTGSVTFYTTSPGYYIINARDWGAKKLFKGGAWPGISSSYTFSNLAEGLYSFNTLLPTSAPSNVDYPATPLDIFCAVYTVRIAATSSRPLAAVPVPASDCRSDGSLVVEGLPANPSWGIKFPGQSVFTSTSGNASVTSPGGLSLKPGSYIVEVSENWNVPSAVVYKLPVEIKSTTGECNPWLSTSTNMAPSCNSQTVSMGVQGIPTASSAPFFRLKWPRDNGSWDINWAQTNVGYQHMPHQYNVVVNDNTNNFNTPNTAVAYTLPIKLSSSTGACPLGTSNTIVTTSATSSCNTIGAGDGTVTMNAMKSGSYSQSNGVWFPGASNYSSVPTSGIISSNNIGPGNYAVKINDDANNASAPFYLLAFSMPTTAGGGPFCSPFTTTTNNASNCSNSNGTITINNLPNAANSLCVRFPGQASFTVKSAGTSMTSSGLVPNVYNVEVNTSNNVSDANAGRGFTYYVRGEILRSAGGGTSCARPAPTIAATNSSNCATADGRITVTVDPILTNSAFGVRFPNSSWFTLLAPGTTTITSPKFLNLPPGTYTIPYTYDVFNTNANPPTLTITIGAGDGSACPKPQSAYTVSASQVSACNRNDARITISGMYANEGIAVLFPGYTTYLMANAGQTSITSPSFVKYAPGNYTVKIRTNAYDANSLEYSVPVSVTSSSGPCSLSVPSLTATATNLASCFGDSSARITVSGFISGQRYGVLFPGASNFIMQDATASSITSPPTFKITKGINKIVIARDAEKPWENITTLSVLVVAASGPCPEFPVGFGDDPTCNANVDTIYYESFGNTNLAPAATFNGTLPSGYVTGYNKVDMACDQPVDDNYAIVNTTNVTALNCPAGNNNRIFGNFQHSTDHTGDLGGIFMLINGAYIDLKLFEKTFTAPTLCPNTEYAFSLWVKDLEPYLFGNIYNFQTIRPALSFFVNDVEVDRDTILASAIVPQGANTTWERVGFRFFTDATGTAKITVRNNAPGGIGNDFAFDDVLITKCIPFANLVVPFTCANGPIVLLARLVGGTMLNPSVRWMRNGVAITPWQNPPSLPYTYTGPYAVGDVFRLDIAEFGSTGTSGCVFKSNSFVLRGVGGSCVVLAETDFTLTGLASGSHNVLEWNFNNQSETNKYEIELSTDGVNFISIYSMQNVSGLVGSLRYNHYLGLIQNYYYRIKAELFGGRFTYSPIVLVSRNQRGAKSFDILSNILRNGLVQFRNGLPEGDAQLSLFDVTGKELFASKTKMVIGQNTVPLPEENLAEGIYLLKVMLHGKTYVYKMLKNE